MPELPEVETIRRALAEALLGLTIESVTVFNLKSFFGSAEKLRGKIVAAVERRGKVLNIGLNDGSFLNIHLKMSGQLLYSTDARNARFPLRVARVDPDSGGMTQMPCRTTRVMIAFTNGSALYFNDQRKLGWIRHGSAPEGTQAPDGAGADFTLDYFHTICRQTSRDIKTLLMDQTKIAGIGNIYANEALFLAGVHPQRPADSLSRTERERLFASARETIASGIVNRGTSATAVYVAPDGSKGSYQEHFKVYSREGLPCLSCGTPILRIKHAGRSSFFCPRCQPMPETGSIG